MRLAKTAGSGFESTACRFIAWERAKLEVEAQLRRHGARRNVVGSTEGGEEVIERVFVGDVDGSQAEAPFVAVALEEVVLTNRRVEKATRLDTRGVVVVVARTR